jgi:phospholipid/cholesterol/gamma-HCH transport system permease protein
VNGLLQSLGRQTIEALIQVGHFGSFVTRVVRAALARPFRLRRVVNEIYDIGVLSLVIICTSGAAVGLVLGLQGYNTLTRFGAEEALGTAVVLTLVRELGPVLTSLLVTGRAGSAIAAEIGSMVATEQMDGLRMMSIDPVHFVAAPKALAMLIAMPLLSGLFIVFGLAGGYVIGVEVLGIDSGAYIAGMEQSLVFEDDVVSSLLKSVVFGALVGLIATFRGYMAAPNAEGVSRATTSTVVQASVATLVVDYIITALWGV